MFLFTVTNLAGQVVATISAADHLSTTPFVLAPVGPAGNVGCLPGGELGWHARAIARTVANNSAQILSVTTTTGLTVAMVTPEEAGRELDDRGHGVHNPSRLDSVTDAQLQAAAGLVVATVETVGVPSTSYAWRHKDGLVAMLGTL